MTACFQHVILLKLNFKTPSYTLCLIICKCPAAIVFISSMVTISRENIDDKLSLAIICFAISIPFLSLSALHAYTNENEGLGTMFYFWLFLFGAITSMSGIALIFFSLNSIACLIFIIGSLVSWGIFYFTREPIR
jgi:hypothetical protein